MNKQIQIKGSVGIEFGKRFDVVRNQEFEDFKNIVANCSLNCLLPFDKKTKRMISFDDLESRILSDQKTEKELSFSFIARSLPMEVTFFKNTQIDGFWPYSETDGYNCLLSSLDSDSFPIEGLGDTRWKNGKPELAFYIKCFYWLVEDFMVHQMCAE
jgi:hypothetical protein